ncbi:MAG: M48 family metallopeptidase [Candidatus Krumholzibacteria bacterium]
MMWELIRQNRRKSMTLFVGMAVLLVALGFFIGSAFDPDRGGVIGVIVAVGMWLGITLISVNSASGILLKVSGAREVTRDVHPRLFNVVEEMKIAAGLPAMPKVYIIDEPSPNALAIGMSPEKSAIAVTAGLLTRLNRDELQGVVAHEMSHIVNRDSQLMTVAGIMLGSIVLLSQVFLRSWWFMPSSSRRYRSKSPGGGSPQLQLIMVIVAVLLAILAPIFARLLYLAISRKREYLADATAVQLTRYPEGLASALEKISAGSIPLESANQVTAPMYIHSPVLKKGRKLSGLGSTHPPIQERIKILRYMSKGADYYTYQKAFNRMHGKPTLLIPAGYLDKKTRTQIRQPTVEPEGATDAKTRTRDVMDLMRAVNNYAFLVCACGLKMKLPPNLPDKKISCPKCGRDNEVPVAELAAIGAMAAAAETTESAHPVEGAAAGSRRLEYTRKGTGWETFACACGKLLQMSPAFKGSHLTCNTCGRTTRIKY